MVSLCTVFSSCCPLNISPLNPSRWALGGVAYQDFTQQAKVYSKRRLWQGPAFVTQAFCKWLRQLNRGNGAGLVFHLDRQRAGNGAPGGEARQPGGSESQARLTLTSDQGYSDRSHTVQGCLCWLCNPGWVGRTRLGGTGVQGRGGCPWTFLGHAPALGS